MNTTHFYEFFDARDGNQIERRTFTVQDTDVLFINGDAHVLQPKTLLEQLDEHAVKLSKDKFIPRKWIGYAEVTATR